MANGQDTTTLRGWLWQDLKTFLADPIQGGLNNLKTIGEYWKNAHSELLTSDHANAVALQNLLKAAFTTWGLPESTASALVSTQNSFFKPVKGFETILQTVLSLTAWGAALKEIAASSAPFMDRAFAKKFSPNWPDVFAKITALRRKGEFNLLTELPAEYGFSTEQIPALDLATQSWLSLDHASEIKRRGLWTEPKIIELLKQNGVMQADHADALFALWEELLDPSTIAELYRRGLIDETEATKRLSQLGFSTESVSYLFKTVTPILPVNVILEARHRKLFSDSETLSALKLHGIRNADADKVVKTSDRLLDPYDISQAMFRGVINTDDGFKELEKYGLSAADARRYMKVRELLPAPTDLMRFGVREVFTPEIAARFGQGMEFPAGIIPWGKKLGYPEEVMRLYWAAHWDLPAPGQGFDMYHRGIISKDELAMLLKALDVMPYWRDKLIKLSDNIMPRRVLGSMIKNGILDRREAAAKLFALGYSRDDSDKMAQLLVIEAAGSPRELTKADLLSAYEEGLTDAKYTSVQLAALGYLPHDITLLMARSKVRREIHDEETSLDATASEVKSAQDATSKAILKNLADGVLSVDQARKALTGLNIPPLVVDYRIAAAELQAHLDAVQAQSVLAKNEFAYGVKDRNQTVAALTSLGYSPAGAVRTVDAWKATVDAERVKEQWTVKLPTKADCLRWLKKGIISADECVYWLRAMNYSDEVIALYLAETLLPESEA